MIYLSYTQIHAFQRLMHLMTDIRVNGIKKCHGGKKWFSLRICIWKCRLWDVGQLLSSQYVSDSVSNSLMVPGLICANFYISYSGYANATRDQNVRGHKLCMYHLQAGILTYWNWTDQGWGLLKLRSSISPLRIFSSLKTHVRIFKSHPYLTNVTAAKLPKWTWHSTGDQ